MPIGIVRSKVLYGILAKRPEVHFYSWMRIWIAVGCTVLIALLPLTDTLRLDLWAGRHMLLGKPVSLVQAAKAFVFPFLAVNILIILVTRFFGRYLCGFACPVGALARIAEWTRFRGRRRAYRILGLPAMLLCCLLLAAITFYFWADWRVFVQGTWPARGIAATFLLMIWLGLFAIVYGLGLGFCRNWCPSGVYFAVLGHRTVNGIEFAHPENCTHCNACERVCPADLKPTQMAGGEYRGGLGFYGDGMSNFALCLRCGDCVIACQGITASHTEASPLRMGWLPEGAREHRDGVQGSQSAPATCPRIEQSQEQGWKAKRA